VQLHFEPPMIQVVAERVGMKKEPLWYPYGRKKGKTIAAMIRMTSAKDWRRRLGR
jgi:hypothetical protein